MIDFKEYYQSKKTLVDIDLNSFAIYDKDQKIAAAMRYSLLASGKRFRPVLVLMIDDLFKISKNHHRDILKIAVSLEYLHTYSLIHDDLPAMDNDDLRRGIATCHKKFDEGTAILAGDGLLTAAFSLLGELENSQFLGRIITAFTRASGYQGMVGGQMLDIQSSQKNTTTLTELQNIHRLKTGAIIRYASHVLALYYNQKDMHSLLDDFGAKIGLLFQIVDDILEVTQTTAELGKNQNSDQRNNKATYVTLLSLTKAKQYTQEIAESAKEVLSKIEVILKTTFDSTPDKTFFLKQLVDYIINRTH